MAEHRSRTSDREINIQLLVWTTLIYLVLMPWARAATFDCNKASTFVEKVICSDSRLTSMDDQLGRLYKDALAASSDITALKTEQKAWLSSRNQCKDSDCIMKAYADRISALSAVSASAKSGVSRGHTHERQGGRGGSACSANGKWSDQVLPKRDIAHEHRRTVRGGSADRGHRQLCQ